MRNLSSILSSCLGNILEWYDFGLFSIFSVLFSHLFFPTSNHHTALLYTLSIFAVGFFCRPLGALIFGYMGDKWGRAKTLRLSILMVSLPTLFIGILPTFAQIGIWAPILLILTRVWQGISIGGEFTGNLIYLAETAPTKLRATFTSLAATGANLGILAAEVIGFLTTHLFSTTSLETWGWRLPYLLSGIFCLLIYRFRLQLSETLAFKHLRAEKHIAHNPIKTAILKNYKQMLYTLGLVCAGSTFYYFCFIYIPVFLNNSLHHSIDSTAFIMACLLIAMLFLVPLLGFICDQVGRRKMLIFNSAAIAIFIVPGFYLLQLSHLFFLVAVLAVFTILSSSEQATTGTAAVENFPLPARYTGLSISYNIGNGLLGGTIPFVSEWLLAHTSSQIAPAVYVGCCATITLLVAYFFIPETRGKSLEVESELS